MSARLAWLLLALAGCGRDAPPAAEPSEIADGAALEALLADPAYAEALAPAEDAVAADLPVRAADRIRELTLPAARRQLERLRAFSARSSKGRRAAERANEALAARVAALETYGAALERGLLEDLVLVDALRAMRRAEESVSRALSEAATLRGESDSPAPGASRPRRRDTSMAPAARSAAPR